MLLSDRCVWLQASIWPRKQQSELAVGSLQREPCLQGCRPDPLSFPGASVAYANARFALNSISLNLASAVVIVLCMVSVEALSVNTFLSRCFSASEDLEPHPGTERSTSFDEDVIAR
jgi:hypothetical protein